MAGIRFRFGLSKHTNPSTGLARHMTDPIRRDLNVVSENFNTTAEFYKMDGRRARVDLVDGSLRNIDDAVAGTDTAADIIGVRNNQTADDVLAIGSRNLIITGSIYSFEVTGHPYTVYDVGVNGTIAGAAGSLLFNLEDTSNVTLQYLTLSADDDVFMLENSGGGSFGHLTIDHSTINAPIILDLNADDSTGQITFTNNLVDILDSSATESLAGGGIGGIVGLGLFVTGGGDPLLTVNVLKNNQFKLTNSNSNGDYRLYALDVEGSTSASPVQFPDGIKYNTITVKNNYESPAVTTRVMGFYSENIQLSGNFSNNQLTVSGYASATKPFMSAMSTDTFTIINHNFNGNRFEVTNIYSGGDGVAWSNPSGSGEVFIGGSFFNNRFIGSGNDSIGKGIEFFAGPFTIKGDFFNNQFITNDNGFNTKGLEISGTDLDIEGSFFNNTFIANNNGASEPVLLDFNNSTVIITGSFYNNQFEVTDNTSAAQASAWCVLGSSDMTIGGDVLNNYFELSNNIVSRGLEINGSLMVEGKFANNSFELVNNATSNIAIQLVKNADFQGVIQNNRIIITDSIGATNNIGFDVNVSTSEEIDFGRISGNLIQINNDSSANYGFDLETNSGTGTINFNGNSSPGELSSSNNSAVVNPPTSGNGIFYKG
jgi:hypothetical protein